MKLVTFRGQGMDRWGALQDGGIIDLTLTPEGERPSGRRQNHGVTRDILSFIQSGERVIESAAKILDSQKQDPATLRADALRPDQLLAPLPNPSKIIAVGWNYWDHLREQHIIEPPEYPVLFPKFPSSIIGTGAPVILDPSLTQQLDFEAELGVVIGKRAKNVSVENALDYVFGYCNLNDISARDLQYDPKGGRQYTRGKSLDTFCPMGPYLVTKDEIPDPQNLDLQCWVNGKVMQDSNTGEMIRSVADLIAFISNGITLQPGDILATGTPAGVGQFRKPPVYLSPGDLVEMEIEGLGRLSNQVVLKSEI